MIRATDSEHATHATSAPAEVWRQRIRDRAKELHINHSALGRMIGVTPGRMSLWVGPKAQGYPRPSDWIALSRALRLPLERLMDDNSIAAPAFDLSPQETLIIQLVRVLGSDEALRRLYAKNPDNSGLTISADTHVRP